MGGATSTSKGADDDAMAAFGALAESWLDDDDDPDDLPSSSSGSGNSRPPRSKRALEARLGPKPPPPGRPRADVAAGPAARRPEVTCMRCHSLVHYGKAASDAAEDEVLRAPFDVREGVGKRLRRRPSGAAARRAGGRHVVLVVVDGTDFDGSLPRSAVRALCGASGGDVGLEGGASLVLAVNKLDLLPGAATEARILQWARRRAREGGLPRPAKALATSAATGRGIPALREVLATEAGEGGRVWVVGAQNAGKSSLVNALVEAGRRTGAGGATGEASPRLTTAALPGTTLDVIAVPGALAGALPGVPPQSKRTPLLYDTPGVAHGHQLSARLGRDELALALPRGRLRPRTYRVGAGAAVAIGGLARVAVTSVETGGAGARRERERGEAGRRGEAGGRGGGRAGGVPTVYLTVWCSGSMALHSGPADRADAVLEGNIGGLLRPPANAARLRALSSAWGGPTDSDAPLLEASDVVVRGSTWDAPSADIAIAGLGWVAVTVSGSAVLTVQAPHGVAITSRAPMMPDRASRLERPGWSEGSKQLARAAAEAVAEAAEKTTGGKRKRGGAGRAPGSGRRARG